jgi:hypothetical protein
MTQTKKQLDELFKSVASDTPALERDELRLLLEQKASGNPTMEPLQTSITTRKRGYMKGIITMSITSILLTAFFLFYSNGSNTNEKTHLKAKAIGATEQSITNKIIIAPKMAAKEKVEKQPIQNDSAIKYLGFNPVDLSCVTPIAISLEDRNKIGILAGESGELIFYHAIKVGFPMSGNTKTYDNYTEEEAKPFTKLPFHPTYATDSKGNLLMNYKYSKDSNGERSFIDLGDHESEYNQMLNSTYIPIEAIENKEKSIDSSQNPWIITTHYHIRNGIMTCDTTMSWQKDVGNQWIPVKQIRERLRAKDSLYKAQFGGEKGMRLRFQFPDDYSNLTPFERTVRDSLDNIQKRNFAKRKDMLDAQGSYLWSLGEKNISDTLKLIIHELSIKIGYEGYILAHQEQEKELANITSLIPIQIRENTGLKADAKYDNGLIFWYEPNKELFKVLPQLQKTLSAEACTPSNDQKMQNVSIYPNPASMYLFINYTLSSSAKLSISILDLSGKIVTENISSHTADSGEHKESITLGDIPPGVYLVLLKTDSGEQSIQRLVITK